MQTERAAIVNPRAMEPFGEALRAHFEGEKNVLLTLRRDDGVEVPLPIATFFREEPEFSPLEGTALRLCRGHVLDVGAGTGKHSLALQRRGHSVTAIDINTDAVVVMRRSGVQAAVCEDVFCMRGFLYDTLLLLGHGIGMVESIDGLKRFLHHARTLLSPEGELLLDSLDVRATNDPANHGYQERNKAAGRYVGEIRIQFEFRGNCGPFCGWLQVDPETLSAHAESAGWNCTIVHRDPGGDYLARLWRGGT
jgi:2-polyprenyl-3-methyl-5-hydroxy-6-metoxy-1,4-benzoquinol methylase